MSIKFSPTNGEADRHTFDGILSSGNNDLSAPLGDDGEYGSRSTYMFTKSMGSSVSKTTALS